MCHFRGGIHLSRQVRSGNGGEEIHSPGAAKAAGPTRRPASPSILIWHIRKESNLIGIIRILLESPGGFSLMEESNRSNRLSGMHKYDLGGDGVEYVHYVLRAAKSLANEVLARQAIHEGRVTLLGPDGLDRRKLLQFRRGGLLSLRASREWLIATIMNGLAASSDRSCAVFENWLASSDDPWLVEARSKVFFFGGEVYHYCTGADDHAAVEAATAESDALPFFWGMLSREPTTGLEPGTRVGRETLEELAAEMSLLIVGAYDGEGYLLWNRFCSADRRGR